MTRIAVVAALASLALAGCPTSAERGDPGVALAAGAAGAGGGAGGLAGTAGASGVAGAAAGGASGAPVSSPSASWAVQLGSPSDEVPTEVEALGDGSVIVLGRFEQSLTAGAYTVTSATPNAWFVTRLDTNGKALWLGKMLADSSTFHTMQARPSGGFWLGATTSGPLTIDGALPDGTAPPLGAGSGPTLVGFSADGTVDVAKRWVSSGGGRVRHLIGDGDGAWIVGGFDGAMKTDVGTLTSVGQTDVFIGRVDGAAVMTAATSLGSTGEDEFPRIARSPKDGRVVFATTCSGPLVQNGGATIPCAGLLIGTLGDDLTISKSTTFAASPRPTYVDLDVAQDGSIMVVGRFGGLIVGPGVDLATPAKTDDRIFAITVTPDLVATSSAVFEQGGVVLGRARAAADAGAVVTGGLQGAFLGAASAPVTGNNTYVVGLGTALDTRWWFQLRGGDDTSGNLGRGVTSLPDGSVVVTGEFAGVMKGPGVSMTAKGKHDVYVMRVVR